jgi:membrane protease YdiL (CAAX protease family)
MVPPDDDARIPSIPSLVAVLALAAQSLSWWCPPLVANLPFCSPYWFRAGAWFVVVELPGLLICVLWAVWYLVDRHAGARIGLSVPVVPIVPSPWLIPIWLAAPFLSGVAGYAAGQWADPVTADPVRRAASTAAYLDVAPAVLVGLYAAGAVFLAPVAEEIAWRGILRGWLVPRVGRAATVVLTGLAFGAAHVAGGPVQIAGATVYGLALGVTRELAGSLRPCIMLHALINVLPLVLAGNRVR